MTIRIGDNLGRYKILDQLGSGGMAAVYKAEDPSLQRIVAIKVILHQEQASGKLIERFEREARALAQLTHPNIVRILDFGEQDGLPYLVMDYVPGGTLHQKLTGPMAWQEAIRLAIPVARALAFAHQRGIVHRDVKPANILLGQTGEPLLSDFGIAKILQSSEAGDLTGTIGWIGTPSYMAPEQESNQSVDGRADLYALGSMLYEMITGRRPYQAASSLELLQKKLAGPPPDPSPFVPGLPAYVADILLHCIQPKPQDRFQTADELVTALEGALANTNPLTPATPPGRKTSYGKLAFLLVPLVLLSIVCAGAILWWGITGRGLQIRPAATLTAIPEPTLQVEALVVLATPTQERPTDTAEPPSRTDGMVLIPGGEYLMGSLPGGSEIKPDEMPQHRVSIGPFWMDEHEVTVSAYKDCAMAGACRIHEIRSENVPGDYFTNPFYDEYPVVDVTWQDASNYCAWKSRRLPTEAEWELAAGGTNSILYPWGNEAGRFLNFCDANCPGAWSDLSIDDGYPTQAPVASFPQGRSPYGLYDMAGNVWEWVADWYGENYYARSPAANPAGPSEGTDHVVRGGGWDSRMANVRVAKRLHLGLTIYTGSLGFRCAMDEQP